jgi:hypothetical protein
MPVYSYEDGGYAKSNLAKVSNNRESSGIFI